MRYLLLIAMLSCATLKDDKTVCAEYRGMRCLAGTKCTMDKARGCQVCHCENVGQDGPDGRPALSPPPGPGER